jgi:hypothetical protein
VLEKNAAFVPIFLVMSITDAKKTTKARQARASALKSTASRKTAKPKSAERLLDGLEQVRTRWLDAIHVAQDKTMLERHRAARYPLSHRLHPTVPASRCAPLRGSHSPSKGSVSAPYGYGYAGLDCHPLAARTTSAIRCAVRQLG